MKPGNQKSKIKSIKSFKQKDKIVLVRVDYNVEVEGQKVLDDTRVRASLETLDYLTSLRSRVILMSHRGRPGGKRDENLSLRPAARHLADLLNRKYVEPKDDNFALPDYPTPHVIFSSADIRGITRNDIEKLNPGDILFLENIRFYKEEDEGNAGFVKELSDLGDIFVNEAFSVCHRSAATVSGLALVLPSFAGLRLLQELEALDYVSQQARSPLVIVAGGAKITEKTAMLDQLLPKSDYLLVGGAMANLFFHALEYEIGDSKIEQEGNLAAVELLRNFKEKIILPTDVVVAGPGGDGGVVKDIGEVKPGEKILDIGPQSILKFSEIIKKSKTIIWNGPMGVFEKKPFSHGTLCLARLIASQGKGRAYTLVGGGESLQALNLSQMREYVDFVSTGGGAMLSYLGGEDMPGLSALAG